jgi:hypothetical protein
LLSVLPVEFASSAHFFPSKSEADCKVLPVSDEFRPHSTDSFIINPSIHCIHQTHIQSFLYP